MLKKSIKRILLVALFLPCIFITLICPAIGEVANTTKPSSEVRILDIGRASRMIADNQFDNAIKLLNSALFDGEPVSASLEDLAQAGMLLCDAYQSKGISKIDPDYVRAWDLTQDELAVIWAKLKQQEISLQGRVERVGQICQGHPEALKTFLEAALKAQLARQDGKQAAEGLYQAIEACRSIEKSAKCHLLDIEMIQSIAGYCCDNGWPDKALLLCGELLSDNADISAEQKASILFQKGEMNLLCGDANAAVSDLDQCLKLSADKALVKDANVLLARCYRKLGRTDDAVRAVRATMTEATEPESLALIGDIYLDGKRYVDASKAFEEANGLEGVPPAIRAHTTYSLGLCYMLRGYRNLARRCMEQVIEKYPNSEWVRKAQGQLYVWDKPKPGQERGMAE